MNAAAAREDVLERALDLTPEGFEVLCKLVLRETLPAATLSVTPRSHDGGIDLEGRLRTDWFAADFGVQAKRNAPTNTVGSDRVHRLGGALLEHGYHVGTFVTTASYSGPAVAAAESLPVQLVDGETLARTMVAAGLGVDGDGTDYVADSTFWNGFGSDADVSTGSVPLANNLERVTDVLRGTIHTDGTPAQLDRWLSAHTDHEMGERHVRINANGAVILGLARTEPAAAGADRYGPTDWGAEYLDARPAERDRILAERIRAVEIVRRLLRQLDERGALSVTEIDAVVAEATDLSPASVDRRGSAVRAWLRRLPEVEVASGGGGHEYRLVRGAP